MASIATVVTMGYGSFGSVNLVPTLGYGIGEPVVAIAFDRPRLTVVERAPSMGSSERTPVLTVTERGIPSVTMVER